MKQKITTHLLVVLMGSMGIFGFAQKNENPWSLEFGVNAVDIYPIGGNAPYGDYLDEFFNLNDHWNMGGFYVGASRKLTKHLSISARGSSNELSKWGEVPGDESILVDNLKYYSLDGMVDFKFTTNRLQPYLAVGGGYTWIEEGPYNTFSLAKGGNNLVGAGTLNGAIGTKYQLSDNLALNLQFMYKHAFEDYLTKHWQHSLGLVFSLGNKNNKKEEIEIVDTDGDGIPDDYDVCPNLMGLKEFGGCPDGDGDGVPDNLDKCPNVRGSNINGCPDVKTEPTESTKVEVLTSNSKIIYFEYNSVVITNNAKTILDGLVDALKSNNSYEIQIDGHADNIGSDSYNSVLSGKRAENVKNYLVSKGLAGHAINTKGYGESKPTANNGTQEGRALNRRSVLSIKVMP